MRMLIRPAEPKKKKGEAKSLSGEAQSPVGVGQQELLENFPGISHWSLSSRGIHRESIWQPTIPH